MSAPESAYEWLALAAATGALTALIVLGVLSFKLRKVRQGQRTVMGGETHDLVEHAQQLQREFVALRDWLEEATGKVETRILEAERRLDGAVAHVAMLRYDAYGEMSGRQSSSIALLDAHRNGVVLSAILHRNHSHLYVKQITDGVSEIDLSPEERAAIDQAMTGKPGPLVP